MHRFCSNPDCGREIAPTGSDVYCGPACAKTHRAMLRAGRLPGEKNSRLADEAPGSGFGGAVRFGQPDLSMLAPDDFPEDSDAPVEKMPLPAQSTMLVESKEFKALHDFFCSFAAWAADHKHPAKGKGVMRAYARAMGVYDGD